jgi:hypothetical protein
MRADSRRPPGPVSSARCDCSLAHGASTGVITEASTAGRGEQGYGLLHIAVLGIQWATRPPCLAALLAAPAGVPASALNAGWAPAAEEAEALEKLTNSAIWPGDTPLHFAARVDTKQEGKELVRLLPRAGADADHVNARPTAAGGPQSAREQLIKYGKAALLEA